MPRSISDIRREIAAAYIADPTVQRSYKLDPRKTYDEQFSKVSLESILFWAFASAVWTLEALFDKHRTEVAQIVREAEPHTLRWYAQRAKAYLHGHALPPYKDRYDLSTITPEEQERATVVRYAVASEYQGVVTLKVAGADSKGAPVVLSDSIVTPFTAYMAMIKDAGVPLRVVSSPGDELKLSLVVYVYPTLMSSDKPTESLDKEVRSVIYSSISGLPFDGIFRTSDLVVALSKVPGVEASTISEVSARPSTYDSFSSFNGYHRPSAGYYNLTSLQINYKPYEPYI